MTNLGVVYRFMIVAECLGEFWTAERVLCTTCGPTQDMMVYYL